MKKRFTEKNIGFLRAAEAGPATAELCRSKFCGMNVFDAKCLKELIAENGRLMRLLVVGDARERCIEISPKKKLVSAPARRELVRHMVSHGLSGRRCLRVVGMSASAYRYEPAQDRNCALEEKIIALAQRHRRYGAGMIYLKLRQAGELVNHKHVDRLSTEAGLQVKKRKRNRIPITDRHPLGRQTPANQAWSKGFVFDRTAGGRSIKNLTVVDDATHKAVAIVPECPLGGNQLACIWNN